MEELRTYSKLHEMLGNEGTDCLSEINSTAGWTIWGYKFAIKKGPYWKVYPQPDFNMNTACDMEVLKVEFKNINESGSDELIIKFLNKEYGSRGGTDYEYLQVWDTDARLLILHLQTKEHFRWWASGDDEGLCKTEVELLPSKIILNPVECNGSFEGFVNENDTTSNTFIWDGAWFVPKK